MKTEIAKKWIAALRSGEYRQAKGRLRDGSSFCCLGVLCNVHAQEFPDIAKRQRQTNAYIGAEKVPPEEVMEWSGLNERNPVVRFWEMERSLAELNDEGESFETIADLIEENARDL